jgi:hypothetical protein
LARIFISHSSGDEDICKFFLQIGGLAGVEIKAMEFENIEAPPWEYIRNQLLMSDTFFVLLGRNVIDRGIYTQNWISFEVGMACEMARTLMKEVWVFEPLQYDVKFPVPFLNHYVLYEVNERTHMDYIRAIMEGYKPALQLMRRIPQGTADVVCPNDHCKVVFRLHTDVKEFYCPACRQGIKLI